MYSNLLFKRIFKPSKCSFSFVLLFSLFLINCAKDKNNTPGKGNITVIADKSFKNVTEALTERYMAFYPETKINVRYAKEDSAFEDLLNNKADVIIMSRELTADEKELYTSKVDLPFQPARFAGDAVVFVTSKNSTRNSITLDEIKKELLSSSRKMIFDGASTGNFNFVAQKFNLEKIVELIGNQSKYFVKEAYQNSHFVILPSKSEGWPKAIAEGMFWGCVPIATPVSCVPFMLDFGNRGLLLQMNLDQDIQQLEALINNELEFAAKSKKAFDWSAKYTLDVFETEIRKMLLQ